MGIVIATRPQTGWIITSGHAGHRVPCMGVMEALDIPRPKLIVVAPKFPFSMLAPWGPADSDQRIAPPWPDIVVASGRQSIPFARKIRKITNGNTFVVVLQNPKVPSTQFDLVWANKHDKYSGPNVIQTITSPHRLTDERLANEAVDLRRRLDGLAFITKPLVGVLIGGKSKKFVFSKAEAQQLADYLARLAEKQNVGLLISPSRRTGKKNIEIIRNILTAEKAWIWDEVSDNPYFGMLGLAERFIVTCDSVNKIGEALFTGKPTMLYPLKGHSSKMERFIGYLETSGMIRWIDDSLPNWSYERPNSTPIIVREILEHYSRFMQKRPGSRKSGM